MLENNEQEKIRRLREAMYSRAMSRKLRTRPRRPIQPTKHNIPSDWQQPEEEISGRTVAPIGIGVARKALTWMLIGASFFFVASVGVFLYFFIFGPGSLTASPGNIDIVVRGPLTLNAGEPAELQIIVTNRNQAALELADLVIEYPPGTRSPADFITDLPQQRISLGSIEPGGRRQGTVLAVFAGKEGDRGNIHVELEYRIADSNAIFVSETDYQLSFGTSPISLSVEANDEAISGQRISADVTVSSNVDTIVKDVLLEVQYPFGFEVDTLTPEPAFGNVWELGDIEPGEEVLVRIRGTLEGQEDDERILRFTVGTRRDRDNENIDVALAEYAHNVYIARPFIGLVVNVNREGGEAAPVVSPGDSVTVNVEYTNNLPVAVTDAVFVARLSGISIPGTSVRTSDGFYRSSDNTVLWDKTTTKNELARLSPGEKGSVSFSFTMPDEEGLLNERNPALNITVHAAGKRVSQAGVPEALQATAQKNVLVQSNVQFIAQGFYYANPFGSVGPLPPKVNEETTYAVVWTLANTSNRIADGVLRATLPPYVRWIGVYSPASEELRFNANSGTIEWDLGSIAPGVGVGGTAPRQVAFAVGLTPSASQVGQTPAIVRNIMFTGFDTFTKTDIEEPHQDVTTNLIDDPGFSGAEAEVEE